MFRFHDQRFEIVHFFDTLDPQNDTKCYFFKTRFFWVLKNRLLVRGKSKKKKPFLVTIQTKKHRSITISVVPKRNYNCELFVIEEFFFKKQ